MSLISFSTISDGTTGTASQVNTPLTTIYNDYNGNITDANIAAGAAIAGSKIAVASLGFGGTVLSQANAGSAGGTMYYVNLGGIKLLWAIGAPGKATGSSYDFTLPTSFFSTIHFAGASCYVPSGVATQYANISSSTTTTIACYLIASAGSGSGAVSLFVVGT